MGGDGYFVEPTIIKDVAEDSELWTEEIFGPVLCTRTCAGGMRIAAF